MANCKEQIANDPIIQQGLGKIAKVNRPSFDAMYCILDGTRRTAGEVSELLKCPLWQVEKMLSKAIATIPDDVFKRLHQLMAGETVETPQQLETKKTERNACRDRRSNIIRAQGVPNSQLSQADAQFLWSEMTQVEQHALFLLWRENLTFKEAAKRMKRSVASLSTIRGRLDFMYGQTVIAKMLTAEVVVDPTAGESPSDTASKDKIA